MDVFLEVQNQRYSEILYLIYYILYGLHFYYNFQIFKQCAEKIQHPSLATSLQCRSTPTTNGLIKPYNVRGLGLGKCTQSKLFSRNWHLEKIGRTRKMH